MLLSIFVFALTIVSCSKESTPTLNSAPTGRQFVIFSQIRYNNTPTDLSQFGLSVSKLHAPGSFLNADPNDPNNTGNPNLDNKIIDVPRLTALAQSDAALASKVPVILDIESWKFGSVQLPATIDSFNRAITIYKAQNTTSPLGFYGAFPQTKFKWSNISTTSTYQAWQAVNNQLAPIVQRIQFFAPDLYTRDAIADSTNWRQFAQANYSEVKRYNTSAKVYAFIQPQYASDASFIPSSYWQFQLEQLYQIGYDGVIIWTSNKDSNGNVIDFNTAIQQGWWSATLNFVTSKNIKAL